MISEILFIIEFGVSLAYFIQIITLTFSTIFLSAVIGLLANLKYPKLNASSDTEIVKQSMSSMISVFIGFGIFFLSLIGFVFLNKYIDINILMTLHILLLVVISGILYTILMKKGPKEYQNLNV